MICDCNLNLIDVEKMDPSGIEPESHPCKGRILPLDYGPTKLNFDYDIIFEPLFIFKFSASKDEGM